MASPSIQLPNPLTPLAWLPPDIANQLEASRYLYSATMGAWAWDLLMSLNEEYMLFTKRRAAISDLVYVLARLSSLAFITTSLVFQVAPVQNCHALAKAIGWCGAFALPLNSLLFFFRIRAVFNQSRIIKYFFLCLWLSTLGCALTAPFGVDGTHIGTTMNCVNTGVKQYSSAGIVAVAVHDTSVFLAISMRLLMYSLADTWSERFRTFFSGGGMGNMSRSLLKSGQLYYMATVGMNIVAMVVILSPSVPPVFRAMFSIPNVALQNAMACRVFRQIKLGLLREQPTTIAPSQQSSPIAFVPISPTNRFFSGLTATKNSMGGLARVHESAIGITSHHSAFKAPSVPRPMLPMRVEINQETQVTVDPESLTPSKDEESGTWQEGSDFAR